MDVKTLVDLARAAGLLQFHFQVPTSSGPMVVAGTFAPAVGEPLGLPLQEDLGWNTDLDREEAP